MPASVDTTIAQSSGFIPQIWAQEMLHVLRGKIVLAKTVARDSDFTAGGPTFNVGNTLNIPYPGTLTAQAKVADTALNVQQPVGGATVAVTLSQHKSVDILVEDVAAAQANPGLLGRYAESAATALAEDLESYLYNLYTGFTSPAVGTAGTDITAATMRAANRNLNMAKVPQEDRTFIVSPKDEMAILGDSNLTNYFAFAQSSAVREGQVPRAFGFDIRMSQLAQPDIATNHVQTVTIGGSPTGGTFTLTVNGQTTAGIAYNAAAATVQTALAGLSSIGTGNVTVTGAAGGPYTVTFTGALAGQTETLTGSAAGLTGGTPTLSVAQTTAPTTRCLAYHKNAIILAMRAFTPPPANAGVQVATVQDPESGLIIRALSAYSIADRGVRVSWDMLYGAAVLRPTFGLVALS